PSSSKPVEPADPAAGGCLYLVGTPIGNLEDITLRALRILKEVDQIACEDTRHTQKLLTHYDIHKPLVSYHEHNELTRAPELVLALEQGAKIALVSDAGMPLVSDPGHRLVTLCLRHRIPVVPIPGPSPLLASLSASGLPRRAPGPRRNHLADRRPRRRRRAFSRRLHAIPRRPRRRTHAPSQARPQRRPQTRRQGTRPHPPRRLLPNRRRASKSQRTVT